MVNSAATTIAHREKTDLLLQPPLAEVDMLNWKHFDRAIALGYEYTVRRLAACRADATVWKHAVRGPRERLMPTRTGMAREVSRGAQPARRRRSALARPQNVLRLLVGRLCLAAQGRDARLDRELARVA